MTLSLTPGFQCAHPKRQEQIFIRHILNKLKIFQIVCQRKERCHKSLCYKKEKCNTMKFPGAYECDVFGNSFTVTSRMLLGKILRPAIEAQCIYKIEGGCKCQSKEFIHIQPMKNEPNFLKSELLYRCIYEHCQVN